MHELKDVLESFKLKTKFFWEGCNKIIPQILTNHAIKLLLGIHHQMLRIKNGRTEWVETTFDCPPRVRTIK